MSNEINQNNIEFIDDNGEPVNPEQANKNREINRRQMLSLGFAATAGFMLGSLRNSSSEMSGTIPKDIFIGPSRESPLAERASRDIQRSIDDLSFYNEKRISGPIPVADLFTTIEPNEQSFSPELRKMQDARCINKLLLRR